MNYAEFVRTSDDERIAVLTKAHLASGKRIAHAMLEKDIWVTYVLERIFADWELSKILRFKGGTSLSKAHGLIVGPHDRKRMFGGLKQHTDRRSRSSSR